MRTATNPSPTQRRIVRSWLVLIAVLVFVMVMVGGATRLTESGLSIVEWKPVTGVVPPLSGEEWEKEFAKYQIIPQYRLINHAMSLEEFKTIYWWEWTHRALGRLIGVMFLLPFLWFLWRGWIDPAARARLWVIFALGGLQGAVGWWMVASGLSERTDVSQYRLAAHLTLACLIYAALIWSVTTPALIEVPRRFTAAATGLLGLVLLQIYLGALVAGLDAGLIYNSWPLMDDHLMPPIAQLFSMQPGWRNFFENRLTVQFDHRVMAYLLWVASIWHASHVWRSPHSRTARQGALAVAAVITAQAGLGIATLVHQTPIALALAHQAMAMIVLTAAVVHARRMSLTRVKTLSAAPGLPVRP